MQMILTKLLSLAPNDRFQAAREYISRGMTKDKIVFLICFIVAVLVFIVVSYFYSKRK
jgi:type VI protein secretion system component VasF